MPKIASASVSPANLPAAGGYVLVTASITDANGAAITNAVANILSGGVVVGQITLTYTGTGTVYKGTFTAPANPSTTLTVKYTATVGATDSYGETSALLTASGSSTVAKV